MNTLFRKGYLLTGMIMAANMFVVNEVKATTNNIPNEDNNMQDVTGNNEEKDEKGKNFGVQVFLNKVLSYENTINLIGGTVSSVANNYLKWRDYNPGKYSKLGCFGWRSKRFLNDILQFDINLNCGRCALWMIATFFESYKYIEGRIAPIELTCTASVIMNSIMNNSWVRSFVGVNLFFFLSCFQGIVSMPIAIHISNFSISISLDSILWAGIGKFLEPEVNNDGENKDINAKLNNTIGEKMIEMEDVNNEVENNKNKIFQIKNKTTKRANN